MNKLLKLSFCALLALPVAANAQALKQAPAEQLATEQKRVLDIQEVTSPGGITAWLVEDHTLPIISLKFAFKGAGAVNDPEDKQGLTQLLSNTLDEGAGPYDSQTFQKMLSDNNISLGFSGGRDNFSGSLKTLTKYSDKAFELLKLALNEPRFDEEPVGRMRAANMTRIRSSLSDPDWKAARLLNDIAFAGHPYALNSGGTLSTLQTITSDDLRAVVKSRLGRDNLDIAVVGAITAEQLKTVIDEVFGILPQQADLPAIKGINVQNGGEIALYKQDIPQTIIEIMQEGIGREDPEYYTGIVMNFILGGSGFGSRLTEEIREKRGLTYGIGTYFYDLEYLEGLGVSTSTKNESVGEMLQLIKAEWERMRSEVVTDKELANAKSYLIGSLPLSLSSTDRISGVMLGLQLDDLPIDYLDHRAAKINAVSAEDVHALAQELLTPEQLTIIMVGNPQGVTPTKIIESLPNVE